MAKALMFKIRGTTEELLEDYLNERKYHFIIHRSLEEPGKKTAPEFLVEVYCEDHDAEKEIFDYIKMLKGAEIKLIGSKTLNGS